MRGAMMKILQGRGIIRGRAAGPALITKEPVNFTAAFTKKQNILFPWMLSKINDHHHELYKKNVKDTIFIYPATIGSTGTGMVLLELMNRGQNPAGIIIEHMDTLMISGPILADIWLGKLMPVVEYGGDDLFESIRNNDRVELDGDTGEIKIF
jgi:uncharacterized protein